MVQKWYYHSFSNLDQNVCSLFQQAQRRLSSRGKTVLPSMRTASRHYQPSPHTRRRKDHWRSRSALASGPAPWIWENKRTRRVYEIHPGASDSLGNHSKIKSRSLEDAGCASGQQQSAVPAPCPAGHHTSRGGQGCLTAVCAAPGYHHWWQSTEPGRYRSELLE